MKLTTKNLTLSHLRGILQQKKRDYTTGNIEKNIILLSIPMVSELSMEALFVCGNFFFVSHLGANAISIAGATTSFITVCYSVSVGLGIAASTMISRNVGAKKFKNAGQIAMQVIYISIVLALLISLISGICTKQILKLVGLPSNMINYGNKYSFAMFISSGFLILRMVNNAILRGAGDARGAMWTLWFSNASNILLCPILMYGFGPIPAYGFLGIGLATVIARFFAICIQAWRFFKQKTVLNIGYPQLFINFKIIKRIFILAFAGTIQFLIPSSTWLVMINIMSRFGSNALSGYILAQRVTSIAIMPAWGIGNAAGILTGLNLGARQFDRAEKSVWKSGRLNMIFLVFIGILWIFLAPPVVRIFSDSYLVIKYSIIYIHVISISYILLGYTMVISRALNAAGDITTITLLYVFIFYIFQIPLAYFLGIILNYGPNGIFGAVMISEIVLATICILIFRKGKWKLKNI